MIVEITQLVINVKPLSSQISTDISTLIDQHPRFSIVKNGVFPRALTYEYYGDSSISSKGKVQLRLSLGILDHFRNLSQIITDYYRTYVIPYSDRPISKAIFTYNNIACQITFTKASLNNLSRVIEFLKLQGVRFINYTCEDTQGSSLSLGLYIENCISEIRVRIFRKGVIVFIIRDIDWITPIRTLFVRLEEWLRIVT